METAFFCHNYGYRSGIFNHHRFYVSGKAKNLILSQILEEGNYESTYKNYKIIIHGVPFECKEVVIDGKTMPLTVRNFVVGTVKFKTEKNFKRLILR